MHWWKGMIIFPLLLWTYSFVSLLQLMCILFFSACLLLLQYMCVCVRAAARVSADVRVLRTHGPGLGSHDWERSQGQNHATLKQLSHHFLLQRTTPASLSLFHFLAVCLSPSHTSMHPHSLFLPLFLSEMSRSSHSAEFPTTVTLFSMLLPPSRPLPRPTEDNMRPSVWSH